MDKVFHPTAGQVCMPGLGWVPESRSVFSHTQDRSEQSKKVSKPPHTLQEK
jgi:hypothetical protein